MNTPESALLTLVDVVWFFIRHQKTTPFAPPPQSTQLIFIVLCTQTLLLLLEERRKFNIITSNFVSFLMALSYLLESDGDDGGVCSCLFCYVCTACAWLAHNNNEKMYKDDNATGNTLHFNLMILVYTQHTRQAEINTVNIAFSLSSSSSVWLLPFRYKPPKTILSSLCFPSICLFDLIQLAQEKKWYAIWNLSSQESRHDWKKMGYVMTSNKSLNLYPTPFSLTYLLKESSTTYHIIQYWQIKELQFSIGSALYQKACLGKEHVFLWRKIRGIRTWKYTHLSGYLSTHDMACREVEVKKKEWEETMSACLLSQFNSLWILNTLGKKNPIQFLSIPQSKQPGSRI